MKKVTPYVGVWIETPSLGISAAISSSLLMWECGLKLVGYRAGTLYPMSLLMWECGLKR